MNLDNYIGKVFLVKITEKINNYYIAKIVNDEISVYLEDTGDYEEDELIGTVEKCIILEKIHDNLMGFLLTNRKFVNDIKKIDKSLQEEEEYHKVDDIYLMERLKIKGNIVGLYLVDEGDIGKYYLGDKEIGTYLKKKRENNILIKENTIENEIASQIKDVVQSIDLNKKEISLRREQQKEKEAIENALNLDKNRRITRIATVQLMAMIKAQQAASKAFKKPELGTTKDVNIKQEMDTNDMVTDMKTLGKTLEDAGKMPKIDGKEFDKIGIIESDERDNLIGEDGQKAKANTTRYSFVAMAKDGTVVPLDIEQDSQEGNNPREQNLQVTHDGEVKQDDVLSRFKVGEGTFSVKNGEYGELKVYHSPRKTIGGDGIEGNHSLDRELETDNVWSMKKNERDLASDIKDGYRSVEEGYQEAKRHEDKSGKLEEDPKVKTADVDGDLKTKSHKHYHDER